MNELNVSRIAQTQNALCRFRGVKSYKEFLVALFHGLAANMDADSRKEFAKTVTDVFQTSKVLNKFGLR